MNYQLKSLVATLNKLMYIHIINQLGKTSQWCSDETF